MFDETNTKDWQQSGNGVFLLREIPGQWVGTGPDRRPATENEFALSVHHTDRDRLIETVIAGKIADALNGPKWQTARPTEQGDYYLSIAPEKLRPWPGLPGVIACEVASWAVDTDGLGTGLRIRYLTGGMWLPLADNPWFDGAMWAKRETPANPFTRGG